MIKFVIPLFLFFLAQIAKGQVSDIDSGKTLGGLFGELSRNITDNDRLRVNDSIALILDTYTQSDTIFTHRFSNIRNLGQIISPDSLIKIVTWNLLLRGSPGRYYAYIIRRTDKTSKSQIYRLSTEYKERPVSCDSTFTEADWYGALYYEIRPCFLNGNPAWVILGIDYGNMFISRKLIDVLSFTPDNKIVFGKQWFKADSTLKYRDVFEYASNGMMSLRFRSNGYIVFDHLVPFAPSQKDDRQYYGPDYSYDAYIFKDGIWSLTINVDARNIE